MTKYLFLSIAFATAFLCSAVTSTATTLISSAGGDGPVGFNDTVGFSFTIGSSPLSVTQLGVWDSGNDGLDNSNQVGLWNNTGTLLASVTILSGSAAPLVDGFRYSALGLPVTLSADTTYVLGAFSAIFENRTTGATPPTFSSDATLVGSRRNDSQGNFSYPDISHGSFPNQAIVGPNMQYGVVPEPSSALLCGFGIAGVMGFRRRLIMLCSEPGHRALVAIHASRGPGR